MAEETTEIKHHHSQPVHHHHHHHHEHGLDDSEIFKQHQFRSQKIRKVVSKVLYYFLVIVAILVILGVWYVYTH